jgi:hypothetical protein
MINLRSFMVIQASLRNQATKGQSEGPLNIYLPSESQVRQGSSPLGGRGAPESDSRQMNWPYMVLTVVDSVRSTAFSGTVSSDSVAITTHRFARRGC